MSRAKKLAEEIVMVFKYNPNLSEQDKILAIETRLDYLINDVERGAIEAHKRTQDNSVIVDSRPQDNPALHDLLVKSQTFRGPLN